MRRAIDELKTAALFHQMENNEFTQLHKRHPGEGLDERAAEAVLKMQEIQAAIAVLEETEKEKENG